MDAEPYHREQVCARLKPRTDHGKFIYNSVGFVRKAVSPRKEKVASLVAQGGLLAGLGLHEGDLKVLNGLKSNSVIEPGTAVYFLDWTESRGEQLTLRDWTHNPLLEKQLMRLDFPVYLAHYCTADGWLPGFLLFTRTRVEWRSAVPDAILADRRPDEPFLAIAYADIAEDGLIQTLVPSGVSDMDCFLQIALCSVGLRQKSSNERLSLINTYIHRKAQIASLHLQVPNTSLVGERRSNEEKQELVEAMVLKLKQLVANSQPAPGLAPESVVPYFDVSFEDIFPELELQEGSKYNKVASQLHVLKDLFGFQSFRKLEDIANQSFYSLSSCFPELKPRATYTSISSFVNVLGEETAVNYILEEPSRIISDSNASQVRSCLPSYLATQTWGLVFDRFVDGNSFMHMVRSLRGLHKLVFLLHTDKFDVFGGFLDEDLLLNKSKFSGTGDCFIFAWQNEQFRPFKATKKNQFYFHCDEEGFGFGADPNFGIYVAENLSEGTSDRCETFDNPPLSSQKHFRILKFEVWALC